MSNDFNDTVQQSKPVQSPNLYVLDIPYIDRIEFTSPDSIQLGEKNPLVPRKLVRTTCFVGEEVHIQLTIIVPSYSTGCSRRTDYYSTE
ncbi:hypothetical protein BLA29_009208 [Euroglyphus maynei]|uniref:Uncharacterized protein n=1 Tax=Euroglyphus maynei TaxID=6958 RepID=A0A1Y3BLS9_EURMA|nr:hypothetical protein BLA29_009208 [Euroglyphus maynei]